ncbi:hypothetical protein B0H10DRAFT_1962485 [Mycena sp. CBHHK59/15]|nr:hypothetical protein B0H10DRAFT_1962485 [Mycena sp. CBHHK59/15]
MAKGHNHKKMKAQRKAKRERMDRQYNLRSTASHINTSKFLACNELILYHMMDVCTLSTLIALSHTSQLFRELVKTLYRIRLVAMIRLFVGHDNIKTFFDVLEATESAIAGSTLAYILAPPIDDVEEWVPSNLNIYTPLGQVGPWEEFFARLQFPTCTHQPGISRAYKTVTTSHLEYESCLVDHPIMLLESIDECVITPATAASTTMGTFFLFPAVNQRFNTSSEMMIATSSTICVLYPDLLMQRRALEAWNRHTIQRCIELGECGYHRNLSTMSWSRSCGWNCPAIWRQIQGLRGIGVFCWGGFSRNMDDNGTVGVPRTALANMKWQLNDTCSNVHCPWYKSTHYFSLSKCQLRLLFPVYRNRSEWWPSPTLIISLVFWTTL